MPRRARPAHATRSEHWLREAVNEFPQVLNARLASALHLHPSEDIIWRSPISADSYAEYSDQEFMDRLGLSKLKTPLSSFWPHGGPCWDGLAYTTSRKCLLVEAKAYIEEAVDYRSRAGDESLRKISDSLAKAKHAFRAREDAPWNTPFYQYANRLAHLHFLHGINGIDAYLVFIYFAHARDVPNPATVEEWQGAIRLTKKCLGLATNPYQSRVADVIIDVRDLFSQQDARGQKSLAQIVS
jgi:hypothetical protein